MPEGFEVVVVIGGEDRDSFDYKFVCEEMAVSTNKRTFSCLQVSIVEG